MVLSTSDLTTQHYSFCFLLINIWVMFSVSQIRYLYASIISFLGSIVFVYLIFHRINDPLAESNTNFSLLAVSNLLGPLVTLQKEQTSKLEYVGTQVVAQRET